VLHGPFGEDGTVQGLLECLDVPYVGAGVLASALCMDKVMFKELMAHAGLPQVDYRAVRAVEFASDRAGVLARLEGLGLPVFVKPARLGSSVGIVRVAAAEDLPGALATAFEHDELAIVEAMASGLEVECGVLGTLEAERAAGAARAIVSQPGEIAYAGEWYDYAAKYEPGGMQLKVPAGISASAADTVATLALDAFAATGCEGLARADFFVDGDSVLLNELNTMPGFTPTSVYAKLLGASGVAYVQLVDRLCRLAVERHERRHALSY
jgi:D-alanine-D-alanine ligase